MKRRFFSKMGEPLSLLGFGCMRLPVTGGQIDYAEGFRMVDYAVEHGINYFDTAYWYHSGESERFIGEALKRHKGHDGPLHLVTKMPVINCNTKEDVERIFEDQLKKCQTDRFDFYLAHSLERLRLPVFERLEIFDFLKKKQEQGYIGKLGFSFHDTPDIFERILLAYPWDFAQIQFNYLDWDLLDAKKNYRLAEKQGIPLTVMEPIRGGALAQLLPKECVEVFQKANPSCSPASWALRWAASHENIAVTLSGMNSYEQVVENTATFERFQEMAPWEYDVVNQAVAELKKKHLIGCTGCQYCDVCPKKIAIPQVFSLYNQLKLFQNSSTDFRVHYTYSQIPEAQRPDHCLKCGLCSKHCPQHLNIPALLETILNEAFSEKDSAPRTSDLPVS